MFLTLNQSMKLVFELKLENSLNKQHVANIRLLTLNKNNSLGLQGKYGLYDSDEWWSNIESGFYLIKSSQEISLGCTRQAKIVVMNLIHLS